MLEPATGLEDKASLWVKAEVCVSAGSYRERGTDERARGHGHSINGRPQALIVTRRVSAGVVGSAASE